MPSYTHDNVTNIETQQEAAFRRTAMLDYWMHLIGMTFSVGLLTIIALIVNYIQRPSARGTIYESHFSWMIRTCWWTILWICVTVPLGFITFGLLGFLAIIPVIWFYYRMIKGLLRANAYQPMMIV